MGNIDTHFMTTEPQHSGTEPTDEQEGAYHRTPEAVAIRLMNDSLRALYLACPESVVDDVNERVKAGIAAHVAQQRAEDARKIAALEAEVSQWRSKQSCACDQIELSNQVVRGYVEKLAERDATIERLRYAVNTAEAGVVSSNIQINRLWAELKGRT